MPPTTILEQIIADRKNDVKELLTRTTLSDIKSHALDTPPPRDFLGAFSSPGTSIIAELKKASPSRGVIRIDFDPVYIAGIYQANGARALSVLTEKKYFQGDLSYLSLLKNHVSLPLLRKDFIVTEFQVWESRAAGADAVLLIARALSRSLLRDLISCAFEAGLEPLVEIHDEADCEKVRDTDARLIGINNRDLTRFTTDIAVSLRLRPSIAADKTVISESGLRTRKDILQLELAGFDGFLIGESLLCEEDIGKKLQELAGV